MPTDESVMPGASAPEAPKFDNGLGRLLDHFAAGLREHADRDGLTGLARAVFLARGGHAPGAVCPTAPPSNQHQYWCCYPDDECNCGGIR